MKKVLLFCLALTLACAVLFAPGATARAADYLLIKDYKVDINVQENNVLDVTENISAYFDPNGYKHGIERRIPVRIDMPTEKGRRKFDIIVTDIRVPGQTVKVTRNGDYLYVRVGDPKRYVSGDVNYTIRYKYDIGEDYDTKRDYLYYNIIGTEWDADIEKASFTVTMPKPFDKNQVWGYVGRYGETDNSVNLSVEGNTVKGTVTRALGPSEGVTLQVELPEGYFTGERTAPPFEIILYVLLGLLIVASVILLLAFGIDKKVIPTVEFYAPDHLTSAEVGYIVDGCVDNKDVVSLIIYWADKGYIEIEEQNKGEIYLKKLKDLPDGTRHYESSFFYGLFKGGDRVGVDSLKNTFYTTMEAVKTDLKVSFNTPERRIFTPMSMRMQGLVSFFTALPFALTIFYGIFKDAGDLTSAAILSVVSLFILLPAVYSTIGLLRNWRSTPHLKRGAKLVWRIIIMALLFGVYYFFMDAFELGSLAVVAMAATLIIAWTAVFMRKRTDKGGEWFGKILGLKTFIEKAEKDRIEMMVKDNPSYFYSVLPFAYVLGVTEKWAKNFEEIGLHPEPPAWYHGYYGMNMFTTMMFMSSINHSLNTMSTTFVSRPAPKGGYSGGGGGFGGGGFSGGGFGGGGGGSW
jgi:uncharacterized membrane protein YgcG